MKRKWEINHPDGKNFHISVSSRDVCVWQIYGLNYHTEHGASDTLHDFLKNSNIKSIITSEMGKETLNEVIESVKKQIAINETPAVLSLLTIKTKQMDVLKEQYEALGLKFVYHSHGSGPKHYSAESGGIVFEIYPWKSFKEINANEQRIGFTIPDFDTIISPLIHAKWEIISHTKETSWGKRMVIKDADGRKVELYEKAPTYS